MITQRGNSREESAVNAFFFLKQLNVTVVTDGNYCMNNSFAKKKKRNDCTAHKKEGKSLKHSNLALSNNHILFVYVLFVLITEPYKEAIDASQHRHRWARNTV